jgi:hypothetical protein
MKLLRPIPEDEMFATFLRAELDSGRYGDRVRGFLARDGRGEPVFRTPDIASPDENDYRRAILEEHRAYGRREGLFVVAARERRHAPRDGRGAPDSGG